MLMLVYILGTALLALAAHDKILLSDIKVLALSEGKKTTGRRHSPVPQLRCRGHCNEWTPSSVKCTNMGSNGRDVTWECTADMPEGYRFGTIDVSCEGYNYPEDAYVLVGSCGLTYELKKFGGHGMYDKEAHSSFWKDHTGFLKHHTAGIGFGSVFLWGFLGLIAYVVYKAFKNSGRHGSSTGSSWNRWGFGGTRVPPPPYGETHTTYKPPPSGQEQSKGPGFWTGLLPGAALGYMLGARGNKQAAAADYRYGKEVVHRRTDGTTTTSSPRSADGGVRTAYGETTRR